MYTPSFGPDPSRQQASGWVPGTQWEPRIPRRRQPLQALGQWISRARCALRLSNMVFLHVCRDLHKVESFSKTMVCMTCLLGAGGRAPRASSSFCCSLPEGTRHSSQRDWGSTRRKMRIQTHTVSLPCQVRPPGGTHPGARLTPDTCPLPTCPPDTCLPDTFAPVHLTPVRCPDPSPHTHLIPDLCPPVHLIPVWLCFRDELALLQRPGTGPELLHHHLGWGVVGEDLSQNHLAKGQAGVSECPGRLPIGPWSPAPPLPRHNPHFLSHHSPCPAPDME